MDAHTKDPSAEFGLETLTVEARSLIEPCLASLEKHNIRCHSSASKLVSWIEKGRAREKLCIVSTACPAYTYERSPGRPPRYTYSGLGEDIGLAGKRFFRSLDAFHSILRSELSIPDFRHEVLVADFEGFSEARLKRVGVTAMEFHKKSWSTAYGYQDRAQKRIGSGTFSNMFGGRDRWQRELKEMTRRADDGELAGLLDKSLIRKIGEERRAVFEQFFGESIDDDATMEHVVTRRALELGTAGKLICGLYKNVLILSISDEGLSRFFGLDADVPVLDMSGME